MFSSFLDRCESATKTTPSTPPQHQLARGVIEHLTRHGIEMESGLESANLAQRKRKEVKEKSALCLGSQGDHLSLAVRVRFFVNILEVSRLAAETRAVKDDFAIDLS
jgi:hypothetical protein